MNELLANPAVVVASISTSGLLIRAGLGELRWWLALYDTSPTERPAIIEALRTPRWRRVQQR